VLVTVEDAQDGLEDMRCIERPACNEMLCCVVDDIGTSVRFLMMAKKITNLCHLKVSRQLKHSFIHGLVGQSILGIGSFKKVHLAFDTNQLHKVKRILDLKNLVVT